MAEENLKTDTKEERFDVEYIQGTMNNETNSEAFDVENSPNFNLKCQPPADTTGEHLVTWDGPDDPQNPLNWSNARKWVVSIVVSLGTFISMMSGTMIAPALPALSHDLHMSEASAAMSLSIYILAFSVAPLLLAPLSEVYGRRPLWLISGLFYSVWNIVCAVAPNKGALIAGRFLSGVSGSVDTIIAGPVTWDVWRPEERGKGLSISGIIPILGPAIGPVIGAIITEKVTWRWIFHFAAIVNAVIIIAGFIFLPETSAARILGQRAKRLCRETGLPYHTEYNLHHVGIFQKIKIDLLRPIKMLLFEPALQLVSLLSAYNFGMLYIILSAYADLFNTVYRQTTLQSGLHYFSLAVGYTIAIQGGAPLMDWTWSYLREKNGGDAVAQPEYRIPLLLPSIILIPVGLLWSGWSGQARIHWIMPDIGTAIFGCGFMLSNKAISSYLLDCFPEHTASAMAAYMLPRTLAAFAMPIFTPAMYNRLGWGWTDTLLALLALAVGTVVPLTLWVWGPRIRGMGK